MAPISCEGPRGIFAPGFANARSWLLWFLHFLVCSRRDGKLYEFAAQGQPVFRDHRAVENRDYQSDTRVEESEGLSAHLLTCLAMLASADESINSLSIERTGAVLQGLEGRAVSSLATFPKTCRVRTSMSLAGRPRCLLPKTLLLPTAVLAEDSADCHKHFSTGGWELGRPDEDDLSRAQADR
jgi:hypothetical protein